MAKMFYTVDEAAQRLGVSTDEVKGMVSSGQLKEFRDKDQLIFKKEQVDLLATGQDSEIPLAEDDSGISLAPADSGPGLSIEESPKEKSGISIFDTDDLDSADPSAVTQVSNTGATELTTESVGSGSGLLDLTRESDDTSLGADLLGNVYGNDGPGESDTQGASGLFETSTPVSDVSAGLSPAMVAVAVEPYDGTWSGITAGLAFGVVVISILALSAAMLGIVGVAANPVVGMVSGVADNPMVWMGAFAGLLVVCAIVGMMLGKKS